MKKKKLVKAKTKVKDTYDLHKDGITNSLLQTWLRCRMAAKFSLEGIRQDAFRDKLELGSLFHELLDKWYNLPKASQVPSKASELFDTTISAEKKKVFKRSGDLQKFEGLLASAYGMFINYVYYYHKQDKQKDWIELEGVFDVNWRGFKLRGKVDGLYRDKGGKLWLFETKTKSRISEDTMNSSLCFDPQNLFYITAKEEQLGEKISGVLYNIVRSPSLRLKKDETQEDFYSRIKEDIASRNDHYFMRYEVKYTEKQKKIFRDELINKLSDFSAWNTGDLNTYKSECSCSRGWNCGYLELCATGSMAGYRNDGILFEELEN